MKVKLRTKWKDEKAEERRGVREEKRRRLEKRKSQKKEDACAGKGRKLRNSLFFQYYRYAVVLYIIYIVLL